MVLKRLGQRLRILAASYLQELRDREHLYPETTTALQKLQESVAKGFGEACASSAKRRGATGALKKRRRGPEEQGDRHRLMKKLQWQKRVRERAESELKALKSSAVSGILRKEWIARVFLSQVPVNPRALEAAWRDLSGATGAQATISHTYIRRVRDAQVEILKGMRDTQIGDSVAKAVRAPQAQSPCAIALVHLHDEASLRLRSRLGPRASMPSRSRSSKVQQHIITVHT